MASSSTNVLIVGAGPTGLTLACELARRGIAVRVVDKSSAPADRSRAIGMQARTVELLDRLGIADATIAEGNRLRGVSFYGRSKEKPVIHVDIHKIDSPYPFVLAIPQNRTEKVLGIHAERLGIHVERGVRLEKLTQSEGGVDVQLLKDDGTEEAAHADWVVGCDGAHSRVREILGVPFEGAQYDERFVLADVDLAWELPKDLLIGFLSNTGVAITIPLGGGRYRIMGDVKALENGDMPPPPDVAAVSSMLTERGAPTSRLGEGTHWSSAFRIARRIVERYREGRVFLAGDAAHVHSPAGGQGMNTGMQDAHDLGWKLALVVQGHADQALLDTYGAERRPIAAETVQNTDKLTKLMTVKNPIAQIFRDTFIRNVLGREKVRSKMRGTISQMLATYPASTIVSESIGNPRAGGEKRGVVGKAAFGSGPKAGMRAPDAELAPEGSPSKRVFDYLRHADHTLFVFDGDAPTDDGLANIVKTIQAAEAAARGHVKAYAVVPSGERPKGLPAGVNVILDPTGAFHRRYGAASEAAYLVRPDGVIGFRSQPADDKALVAHLGRTFV